MPFEEPDRTVLHSLTGKAKQFRTPDGRIWMISGIFKTPIDDPNLLQWLVGTGQLEATGSDIESWVLNEFVLLTPEDVPLPASQFHARMHNLEQLVFKVQDDVKKVQVSGGGSGAPGKPVVDVAGSLAQADAEQLASVGAAKLFAALGLALQQQQTPPRQPVNPPAA